MYAVQVRINLLKESPYLLSQAFLLQLKNESSTTLLLHARSSPNTITVSTPFIPNLNIFSLHTRF